MNPRAYRKALCLALQKAFYHQPGLSIPEMMILLHAPFESDADVFELIPRSQSETAVYLRSLLAQGFLTHSGRAYGLTEKGEELFTVLRVQREVREGRSE